MKDLSKYSTQFIIDCKLTGIQIRDDQICFYKKGNLHSEDGPAIQSTQYKYIKSYFYNGKKIYVDSDEMFKKYIKLMVFK